MTTRTQTGAGAAAGFTLIETVFALTILMIVAAGVMPLALVAVKATENQGHLAARTTEYAQDKLEQLMALVVRRLGDRHARLSGDRRQRQRPERSAAVPTLQAPVNLYVDYLDIDGNLVNRSATTQPSGSTSASGQVSTPRANLKLITVTATVRVARRAAAARCRWSTVSALKTNPF